MTVLLTTDLHLNDLPRDAYRHKFLLDTLPALARQHRAAAVGILGDICDEKDRHPAWLVNRVVAGLSALAKICPVAVLKGNHDYIQAENPFYAFLGRIPGLAWVTLPTPAEKLTSGLASPFSGAFFLPHSPNYERDWAKLDFRGIKWILAHQTFLGARVGGRELGGVPLGALPAVPIFSGDIHVPQSFVNVTYVGAPYLVDFGDDYRPRVLLVEREHDGYAWTRLKVKSIPCPGVQKRLVEISSPKDLEKQRMLQSGDILKVRVNLTAAEHDRWPAIRKTINEWGDKYGFVIHAALPYIAKGGTLKTRRAIDRKSDEELITAYGRSRAVNPETLKKGLELTRRA
jgi:Calcineurin-like phosphoesterase